ncbi:hypothetical protein SDC9_07746 [bioreactor metagenome]|uniref:peptidylprolyl isomerase n=1 Tax=bioreactor metagenome TaxID=1076179 RepID=A0A644T5E4_9ZZZZ|nr:peptidylprolyl isomerase [Candidatus Elulimicrobiales bacterium]
MSKKTRNILIIGFIVVLLIIAAAIIYDKGNPNNSIGIIDSYGNSIVNKNEVNNQNIDINMTNQNSNNQEQAEKVSYTTAVLHTNMGDISFELSKDKPLTTANFIKLAGEKFYDGVKFHRVIKGFMIQTGDPLSKDESQKIFWGTGDPGYKFNDELTGSEKYEIGTVAMANSGPNTNGSQFFIMTSNTPLPPNYTVFGKVVAGQEIAQKIQEVATDSKDRPLEAVTINSVELK